MVSNLEVAAIDLGAWVILVIVAALTAVCVIGLGAAEIRARRSYRLMRAALAGELSAAAEDSWIGGVIVGERREPKAVLTTTLAKGWRSRGVGKGGTETWSVVSREFHSQPFELRTASGAIVAVEESSRGMVYGPVYIPLDGENRLEIFGADHVAVRGRQTLGRQASAYRAASAQTLVRPDGADGLEIMTESCLRRVYLGRLRLICVAIALVGSIALAAACFPFLLASFRPMAVVTGKERIPKSDFDSKKRPPWSYVIHARHGRVNVRADVTRVEYERIREGDRVPMVYVPDHPEAARIGAPRLQFYLKVWGFIWGFCLLLGLITYLAVVVGVARDEELLAPVWSR